VYSISELNGSEWTAHAPTVLQRKQSRCQVNRAETDAKLHKVSQRNVRPSVWTETMASQVSFGTQIYSLGGKMYDS
jgi:hypothetical protein